MKKVIIFTLFVAIIIFSGCGAKTGSSGVLTMQITDAPSELNIEKALVTISEVKVHKGDLSSAQNESNDTTSSGWFSVADQEQTFDLVQIKDVKQFLGLAVLDTGKYTQIRLKVTKAVVTIDGEEMDLKIPSENIKLTKGFNIEANQTLTLTLDFNAQESIHKAGNGYIMRPTIKVIQE